MSLTGAVTTPLLSLGGKLRLMREPFVKPPDFFELEESLASFVSRRFGKEVLDYAVNPFVAGVFAGDPSRLAVRYAFPDLYTFEKEHGSVIKGGMALAKRRKQESKSKPPGSNSNSEIGIFSFLDGIDELVRKMAELLILPPRVSTRVLALAAPSLDRLAQQDAPSGRQMWTLTFEQQHQGSESETFDAVLYTGPVNKLSALLPASSIPEKELALLSDVVYPPLAVVSLGFRREKIAHSLDGFGFLVPEVERREILGTIFSSSLFPQRAPEGHALLTTFVGGSRNPENAKLSEPELIELVTRELSGLLGITEAPVFAHVTFWPEAIPQYNVGYGEVLLSLRRLEQGNPGFFLAGNFLAGVAVGDAFTQGMKAADTILAYLSSTKAQ
eukprot:TRINITY_DN1943_c0_g1_i7.p1 TRINITY_DN1943_c0_g1~~TRINITY_DN1943_c0_g1_i7.p1  ORF type:complete len:386 (-),score=107.80 TRINITY_DN1943_c0_g1_i7:16-1173(-)